MSLPLQTAALLQSARDLVKGLPADAILLLTETALDWEEVERLLLGCRLFAASDKPALLKPLKDNGTASVVVENEELQGRAAFLVLLSASGELVAEANTVIGGG